MRYAEQRMLIPPGVLDVHRLEAAFEGRKDLGRVGYLFSIAVGDFDRPLSIKDSRPLFSSPKEFISSIAAIQSVINYPTGSRACEDRVVDLARFKS